MPYPTHCHSACPATEGIELAKSSSTYSNSRHQELRLENGYIGSNVVLTDGAVSTNHMQEIPVDEVTEERSATA